MLDAFGGGDRRGPDDARRPIPTDLVQPPRPLQPPQEDEFEDPFENDETMEYEPQGPIPRAEPVDMDPLDRPNPRIRQRDDDDLPDNRAPKWQKYEDPIRSPPKRKREDIDILLLETPVNSVQEQRIQEALGKRRPPRRLLELQQSMDLHRGRPGEPYWWEHILGRNVGPLSEVSTWEEAVADSPEAVAAWYHDLQYDLATTATELAEADRDFLQRLEAVPAEERGLTWNLTHDVIASGVGVPYGYISNSIRDIIRDFY